MKSAQGIISVLLFMLLLFLMSMPVFAMQTQGGSGMVSTNSKQFDTGSEQNTSGTVQAGGQETVSDQFNTSDIPESGIAQSSEISLPEVSVGSQAAGILSNGTNITPSNTMQTWLGIVFWVCIAIGILIVVVVIVAATRKPPKGGIGKKRYERRPMTPKGKRILNEKYYRNIKK